MLDLSFIYNKYLTFFRFVEKLFNVLSFADLHITIWPHSDSIKWH